MSAFLKSIELLVASFFHTLDFRLPFGASFIFFSHSLGGVVGYERSLGGGRVRPSGFSSSFLAVILTSVLQFGAPGRLDYGSSYGSSMCLTNPVHRMNGPSPPLIRPGSIVEITVLRPACSFSRHGAKIFRVLS